MKYLTILILVLYFNIISCFQLIKQNDNRITTNNQFQTKYMNELFNFVSKYEQLNFKFVNQKTLDNRETNYNLIIGYRYHSKYEINYIYDEIYYKYNLNCKNSIEKNNYKVKDDGIFILARDNTNYENHCIVIDGLDWFLELKNEYGDFYTKDWLIKNSNSTH